MARRVTRRSFVKGASATWLGAQVALGCRSEEAPLQYGAGTWGIPKPEQAEGLLAAARRPEGILEVFLLGGMNPWDTFYVVPEHGRPDVPGPYAGQQWWTFQDPTDDESIPKLFDRCGGGSRELLEPFAWDSAGKAVHLGPFVFPLRDRPDILSRMRVLTVRHSFAPHQAAVPLMLGGQPRGSPRLAGTGAHMARFFHEQGLVGRTSPYSYVLIPESQAEAELEAEAAGAVGLHQGSARPLIVRLQADNTLSDLLSRSVVAGHRGAVDQALAYYAEGYGQALRSARTGRTIDSRALEDYRFSIAAMAESDQMTGVLTPEALAPFGASECDTDVDLDGTGMGLRLATHLLTTAEHRARYVQAVDSGLVEAFCGGYDTHERHVLYSSRNMVHMCKELSALINEPGEGDPRKLDLDRHLVLLTTEMGRTPFRQAHMDRGLDHWPDGFAVVAIGGPIDASRRGVVGSIGEDGVATDYMTPAELRAGLLLGAGIWPFSQEAFAIGDVRGATSELEAALMLTERMWGPV